jgi:hypothetical protein
MKSFDLTVKVKKENFPQKSGKTLDRFLRGTIVRAHRYAKDAGRRFPRGIGQSDWPMVETVSDDGEVRIDYAGEPVYSAYQVSEYAREFCRLNRLKD